MPSCNELSEPDKESGLMAQGAGLLFLPLLVLIPYPAELIVKIQEQIQTSIMFN